MRGASWRVANEQMRRAARDGSRGVEMVNHYLHEMKDELEKTRGDRRYVGVAREGNPRSPGDEPLGDPEAAEAELPQLSDSDMDPDQEPREPPPPEEPEPQEIQPTEDEDFGNPAVARLAPQSNDQQVRPRLDSAGPQSEPGYSRRIASQSSGSAMGASSSAFSRGSGSGMPWPANAANY